MADVSVRLQQPEKATAVVKSYTKRAKIKIVHKAAAQAWAQGVPWAEALQIADKAMASANGSAPPLKFSAKGRGRGKGKGKRRG